jgi:hypothetical protein
LSKNGQAAKSPDEPQPFVSVTLRDRIRRVEIRTLPAFAGCASCPSRQFQAGLPLVKKYRQDDQDNGDDPQNRILAAAAFLVGHESRVQHSPNR